MLCYNFLNKRSPLAVLRFPAQTSPLTPCGSGSSQSMITMYGAILTQSLHDTQPIAYLISKQVVPYRTRGGICCSGVSTPKIRSLADSNMTNHFTWQNPTVSTIPTLLKPQHRPSPRSNHISTDGRPSFTKTQAKLNIIKDGKTCMTLMTKRFYSSLWTPECKNRLNQSYGYEVMKV
jgi:hypothetical protein